MADLIFPGAPAATLGDTRLPENINLSLWQGDAQSYDILVKDEAGEAIDLTGCTAQAVIRQGFSGPQTVAFDCIVVLPNKVELRMDSATSKAIVPGEYVWNFQITSPNGDVRTYLAGDAVVLPEVDGA